MQVTIAQQLGLDVTTVANFFMNARRRGADRWKETDSVANGRNSTSSSVCSNGNNRHQSVDGSD